MVWGAEIEDKRDRNGFKCDVEMLEKQYMEINISIK
jgi:hypothetical protein